MRYATAIITIAAILLSTPGLSQGISNDWGVEVDSFLLGNFATRTTSETPPGPEGKQFLLAEERLRLDLSAWNDNIGAEARVKLDAMHDAVTDEFDIDLREAYLDYSTDNWDFRFGRQIATWGVGDLLFINDFFPKDWVSFFSGRPLEYLKLGVDGARGRFTGKAVSAEFILIPSFTPNTLPTSARFFLYDPLASVTNRSETKPAATYENTELALRLYRRAGEFDVAAYLYKGFWRSPGIRPDDPVTPTQLTLFYPRLRVYGASAQGNALGGVLSLEAGYYDSRDDRDGSDPSIANSQSRLLIGYQRQLKQDLTLGLQYYTEIMRDYDQYTQSLPAGFAARRRYRDTITLRLEQLLMHQTLRLSLFTFYSPADDDYLIQPKASYQFSDEFSATLGANLFGGKEQTTFLGQFDNNDNLYLSARFDF